jgi:HD domain
MIMAGRSELPDVTPLAACEPQQAWEIEAIMADETANLIADAGMRLDPAERRLLAGMPLHAITSVHGEAGLRERLLMEIARFPPAELGRVRDALALASRLHAGDRRQREPYISHLLRVAIRILSYYRVADADVACAALLHDAVEDHAAGITPGGDRQAAVTVLAGRFGARTAALVAAVTNPEWEPGRDEYEQYREHVLASLAASPWARVIKASDFSDNAVGIIYATGPKLSKLADKYGPLASPLRELILRPDTPLEAGVKDMIAAQLDAARERFAAIGHGRDRDSGASQPFRRHFVMLTAAAVGLKRSPEIRGQHDHRVRRPQPFGPCQPIRPAQPLTKPRHQLAARPDKLSSRGY